MEICTPIWILWGQMADVWAVLEGWAGSAGGLCWKAGALGDSLGPEAWAHWAHSFVGPEGPGPIGPI